jgi:hypothetical protein
MFLVHALTGRVLPLSSPGHRIQFSGHAGRKTLSVHIRALIPRLAGGLNSKTDLTGGCDSVIRVRYDGLIQPPGDTRGVVTV